VAYRSHLAHPERLPLYYGAENWMLKTWWARPAAGAPAR